MGFSFSTLWKEATRAIGYLRDTIISSNKINADKHLAINEQIHKGQYLNAKNNNESYLPIIIVVVLIFIMVSVYLYKTIIKK